MKKIIVLLFFPLYAFTQDSQLEKFVDSLIGPMNKPDVPGTVVLVAQDGKVLLKKAYGLANVELGVPLTTDHAFAIGSVSKQFTAVAVLQLVQQGKLKLTDDMRKYFPSFNTHGYVITIDNLLNHTSGITIAEASYNEMHNTNKSAISPDRFLYYAMQSKPVFEPGTEWSYNNFAYAILATLVERVSGQPFKNYLRDHVFIPAGMTHSYITSDLQPFTNVVSTYQRALRGKWRNMQRGSDWEWFRGSSAVISTLGDMMQWDIALREGKLLSNELLQKAWTPYTLKNGSHINYGYGWDVNNFDGTRIISHSGSVYGFATESVHVPDKKLYVFFANFYNSDPTVLPKRIVTKLLNIQPCKPAKTDSPVSDYAGVYRLHHQGTKLIAKEKPSYMKFTTSGDTLFVQQPLAEKTFLRPAGKDRFIFARSADGMFIFNRDTKGNVVSMNTIPFLYGGPPNDIPNMKLTLAVKPVPQPKIVDVDSSILKNYAGTYYRPETDEYFFVELRGNKLSGQGLTSPQPFELSPVSNNKFVRMGVEDYSVTFKNDSMGLPVMIISGSGDREFKKVD